MTTTQKQKAIEFWDKFYEAKGEKNEKNSILTKVNVNVKQTGKGTATATCKSHPQKEWILTDSRALLRIINAHLLDHEMSVDSCGGKLRKEEHQHKDKLETSRILEIGCGTSRLSRSFLEYVIQLRGDNGDAGAGDNDPPSDTTSFCTALASSWYHVIATDVSEVCVIQNRQRDANFIKQLSNNHIDDVRPGKAKEQGIKGKKQGRDMLDYRVLDILSNKSHFDNLPSSSSKEQHQLCDLDLILDKGCLDTFLFRGETVSKEKHLNHPPLLTSLLNNVHSLLKNGGKYIIITPRSKLKSVRDFNGFSKVKRIAVDSASTGNTACATDDGRISLGDLDGNFGGKSNDDGKDSNHDDGRDDGMEWKGSDRKNKATKGKDGRKQDNNNKVYIYVCYKNDFYIARKDFPYTDTYQVKLLENDNDDDYAKCSKCHITFDEFRNGEDIHGRGRVYWSRRWKGHRVHCKGCRTGLI